MPSRARVEIVPGTLIDGRFLVETLAKTGGMGHIYRALDRANFDARCAIKILPADDDSEPEDVERFSREAQVLSRLRHPGIVSYVAHGFTTDARPYLAMEWLDGEDLATRFGREKLDIAGAVALITSLARALAVAHESGIVHRDLKPANVILRGGLLDRATLVDFGVARWLGRTMRQTRSGALIGTPGYMAPEQARGQFDVGPSADVFALGCILFEALTGKAPFAADHVATVLTKILFEEVPSVRSLRPEVPRDLDALLERLLSKDPRKRPSDAAALLADLMDLAPARPEPTPAGPTPPRRPSGTFSGVEQILFSLVIASPRRPSGDGLEPPSTTMRVPNSLPAALPLRGLSELGMQVEYLADGSVAVIVSRAGSANEQVGHAARCALLLAERMPDAHEALVTGPGAFSAHGRVPEGEVFSRASALLGKHAAAGDKGRGIWLDDVSAGLLGSEFLVKREDGIAILTGLADDASPEVDEGRSSLLGRSIPFVGRERELSLLTAMLEGAIEDESPGAAIIIAPAGMGKSRLLHEMLGRVRRDRPEVEILHGRGDPASQLSPHALLGRVMRALAGVRPGESAETQLQKLEARLGLRLSPAAAMRVLPPLLEVCVAPGESDKSASKSTPPMGDKINNDRVERAFVAWLAAECAAAPVILAIEDLGAADAATARLIDAALRTVRDASFFVMATQRIEDTRPRPTWHGSVQEIRLGGLGKRASERIVRLALADEASDEIVARLVDQAAGNPLYLEELIRAHKDGKSGEAPPTVLAMLQARIQRMTSGARRVLRIASLFGRTFWRGGVVYLLGLGSSADHSAIDPWLDELLDAEMIERHAESRFPEDIEYGFRHGLLRDAAYGLLTEDDKKLGRALVALYLEQAGEHDPAVLAGHTYEIVQYLEARHNSFFVSRLCMLTGLSLRKFTSTTPDDPVTLKKIRRALAQLLRADQIDEVKHLFKEI